MTQITKDKALDAYFPEGIKSYSSLPTLRDAFTASVDAGLNEDAATQLSQFVQQKAFFTASTSYAERTDGLATRSFQITQNENCPLGISSSSSLTQNDVISVFHSVASELNNNSQKYGISAQEKTDSAPNDTAITASDFTMLKPIGA